MTRLVFDRVTDLIPYFLVVYLAWGWLPVAWKNYNAEGKVTDTFSVQKLDGELTTLEALPKPHLLVFWATWCGPCTLELSRIRRLVEQGKIPRESVLAITSETDLELVRKEVRERGYTFNIATDTNRDLFRRFEVTGTPTLVVINSRNEVEWLTSGLSPTLEMRLPNLLSAGEEGGRAVFVK